MKSISIAQFGHLLGALLVATGGTYSISTAVAQTCVLQPDLTIGPIQVQAPNPLGTKSERIVTKTEHRLVQPALHVSVGPIPFDVPEIYQDVPVEWKTVKNDITILVKPSFSFTKVVVNGQNAIRVVESGELGFVTPILNELVGQIGTQVRAGVSESCETSIGDVSAGLSQVAPPTVGSKVDITARLCTNVPTTCGIEWKCDLFNCGPRPKICNSVAATDIASGKLETVWQLNVAVNEPKTGLSFTFSQPLPPTVTVGGGDIYKALSKAGVIDVFKRIGVLPDWTAHLNDTAGIGLDLSYINIPDSDYIYKPKFSKDKERQPKWIQRTGEGAQPYRLLYTREWTARENTACVVIDCLRKNAGATTQFPQCNG